MLAGDLEIRESRTDSSEELLCDFDPGERRPDSGV